MGEIEPVHVEEEYDFVAPDAELVEDTDAIEVMWMERNARPWKPTPSRPLRAVRCTGVTRNGPRAGKRCGREGALGLTVCESHGAKLPSLQRASANRVAEARLRLIGASDEAVSMLIDLSKDASSEAVRLKATTEILDRAGVRGGTDINVALDVKADPAAILRERLEQLRNRNMDAQMAEARVIEGVTVEEPVPDDAVASSDSDASEE